ncbi:MAG: quinoprotein relay system zinc metallohydrolase 1 [Paracoccaceae bacterium]|jgi:quinoprotein relay system zinc metallohydrolase 1
MSGMSTGPTRRRALSLLAASAALAPATLRAAATPRHTYDLSATEVARGIHMVTGATEYFTRDNGGAIVNVMLIETPEGMLIVDTGPSRRYGEALRSLAQTLHPLGARGAVNTHHHPDHFLGNQAFSDLPIRALGLTGELAARNGGAYADNMYRLLGDWMRGTEATPPNRALSGGRVDIMGRSFDALPLAGHTEADLALLDVETGVLIAGDIAFLDRAPTTPSADLPRWQASIDTLAALTPAGIIPGHGPFDTGGASLRQTSAYIGWLGDMMADGARRGLDMNEMMRLPLPDAFAGMGAQPDEYRRSVAHLFPDAEMAALPRAN